MKVWTLLILAGSVGVVGLGGLMWGIPAYKVYSAQQEGKAILAKAEYSRQAQVQDAKAKLESAKYLNDAATVIQSSLSAPYLKYLEIQMQEEVASKNDTAVYFFGESSSAPVVVPVKSNK